MTLTMVKKRARSQETASKSTTTKPVKKSTRGAAKTEDSVKDISTVKESVPKRSRRLLKKSTARPNTRSGEKTTPKRKVVVTKSKKKSSKTETNHDDKIEVPKLARSVLKSGNDGKNKIDAKRRRVTKVAMKSSPSFRQVSLKESFLNQSKLRRLRPRRVPKNYHDETTLIERDTSVSNKPRVPIYKTVPMDDPVNNESEIYEFKPDKDDVRIKKRKKRPTKQTVVQKLMKAREKAKLREKLLLQENMPTVKVRKMSEKEVAEQASPTQNINNPVETNISKETNSNPQIHLENKNTEDVITSETMSAGENLNKPHEKPTIISVETLKNRSLTLVNNLTPSETDDFKPFRPTNIFGNKLNVQNKSVLNHSGLEKDVSPILKTIRNFDPGSPWRAPPLVAFSRIKNLYQSTPQINNNKMDIVTERLQREANEMKNYLNTTKTRTSLQKTNDTERENDLIVNNQKKKSTVSTRKFGTEITNIDQSIPLEKGSADARERLVVESESFAQNTDPADTNNTDLPDVMKPDEDEGEDKENNALNYQTPKKVLKRKQKRIHMRSPLKPMSSSSSNFDKENNDPIPGPSGLQSSKSFENRNEQVVLRQSNLNNFLNLVDTPESTTIKTPHAIFGDTHSPPISIKPAKKKEVQNADISNVFGFTDDDAGLEASLTEEHTSDKENNYKQTIKSNSVNISAPVRLSVGELKNYLLKQKTNENVKHPEISTTSKENTKSPIKKKTNVKYDIANFSDTFDVLSDVGEQQDNGDTIPLFVDLEPSHFTQPPRHSYKRKRQVTYNFSEDSNSEGEDGHSKVKVKRKKMGKVHKGDQKRLQAWINDVNRTFSEIDQYDLVVE